MRKLITAGLAAAAILVAGSLITKVEAAPVAGAGTLPPFSQNFSPVEKAGYYYRRRHYGYRPYYGYRHYGYGYRPYYRPYRYRY